MRPVFWDVAGPDWICARDGQPPETCRDRYLSAIDGSSLRAGILIMHDRNGFALGSDYTLRLTRLLVEALRARGNVRFIPLSQIPALAQTRQVVER